MPNLNPRASIIIATHDRPQLLPRAVESAHAAGTDVEIVVVDDASTDETARVCQTLSGIKYVRTERNQRVAGARNIGLVASRGEYISFLDDDDTRLPDSLDAQIEALDLPVFLHPLQVVGGPRTAPFNLSNILSFPFDTAIAACHLIFGGVLDRHPKLQVTLPHGGGVLLMLMGRIDHGAKVRPEIQKLGLPQVPSKYLQRFTFDTIVHSKSVMEFVISEVGAERIMVGSDYCLDMGYLRPVQDLDALNLPARDKDLILRGTAARLLKL